MLLPLTIAPEWGRPEVNLPPRIGLGIALGPRYEVGESSAAAAARPAGGSVRQIRLCWPLWDRVREPPVSFDTELGATHEESLSLWFREVKYESVMRLDVYEGKMKVIGPQWSGLNMCFREITESTVSGLQGDMMSDFDCLETGPSDQEAEQVTALQRTGDDYYRGSGSTALQGQPGSAWGYCHQPDARAWGAPMPENGLPKRALTRCQCCLAFPPVTQPGMALIAYSSGTGVLQLRYFKKDVSKAEEQSKENVVIAGNDRPPARYIFEDIRKNTKNTLSRVLELLKEGRVVCPMEGIHVDTAKIESIKDCRHHISSPTEIRLFLVPPILAISLKEAEDFIAILRRFKERILGAERTRTTVKVKAENIIKAPSGWLQLQPKDSPICEVGQHPPWILSRSFIRRLKAYDTIWNALAGTNLDMSMRYPSTNRWAKQRGPFNTLEDMPGASAILDFGQGCEKLKYSVLELIQETTEKIIQDQAQRMQDTPRDRQKISPLETGGRAFWQKLRGKLNPRYVRTSLGDRKELEKWAYKFELPEELSQKFIIRFMLSTSEECVMPDEPLAVPLDAT
ncbi:hypothetical protein Tco_0552896 [Tanacetum coccineum]